MMKKTWLLAILLCLCLCMTAFMASCDEMDADVTTDDVTTTEAPVETESDEPDHEHEYADEYSSDDDYHWYACTVEGCDDADKREKHTFGDPTVEQSETGITKTYVCTVCGFEKGVTTTVESIVAGEQAWQDAFTNLELLNFTLEVNYQMTETETQTNVVRVTPDAAYYHIGYQEEYYTVANGDGTYKTYYRDQSMGGKQMYERPFVLLDDTSDRYLVGAQTECVIKVSFAEHFDEFTYDAETGYYLCDGPVDAQAFGPDGTPFGTLRCINIRVKVANGAIVFIDCEYYFDEHANDILHLNYSDIGTTVVTLPDDVSANAITKPGFVPDGYEDAPSDETQRVGYEVGDRAPDGYVELYEGELYDRTGLEMGGRCEFGCVRVINYWGAWCPPCKAELPDFDRIAREYGGLAMVIAIHSAYNADMGKPYVEENFSGSHIIFGEEADGSSAYYEAMGGDGNYPLTVILDVDGTVMWRQVGMTDYETISAVLDGILGRDQ